MGVHPKGPNATAKYTSYARRYERSKRLPVLQLSQTLYLVNGRLVITDELAKPIRCNCPDFTQVDGQRDWIGSAAGPFNPCKHMLAIQRIYKISMTWQTFNLSCQVITGYFVYYYPAKNKNSILIELGDFQSLTCGTNLFWQSLYIDGVLITDRAGGGNSAFSNNFTVE